MNHTYAAGRADQFNEMMRALEELQHQYKGVRGELLAKVRAKLEALEPDEHVSAPAPTPPTKIMCRACGREMRHKGDGALMCQNGHSSFSALHSDSGGAALHG